jgi:hypothetical protein
VRSVADEPTSSATPVFAQLLIEIDVTASAN